MRFLFFCLLLPGTTLSAQQLYGVIADAVTGEALPLVRVENRRSGVHMLSAADGGYEIAVQSDDRVRFSLPGYITKEFLVGSEQERQYQRIPLERHIQHIDTVVVRPGLSDYQQDSLRRGVLFGKKANEKPAQFKFNRPHALYGGTGSFNAPISSLFQKKTKKYKRLKAFQDRFHAHERQSFIDARYTPALVAELTRLSGDSLSAFMNHYPMPYDYARAASDLEVRMWIRYNYHQWRGTAARKQTEE